MIIKDSDNRKDRDFSASRLELLSLILTEVLAKTSFDVTQTKMKRCFSPASDPALADLQTPGLGQQAIALTFEPTSDSVLEIFASASTSLTGGG